MVFFLGRQVSLTASTSSHRTRSNSSSTADDSGHHQHDSEQLTANNAGQLAYAKRPPSTWSSYLRKFIGPTGAVVACVDGHDGVGSSSSSCYHQALDEDRENTEGRLPTPTVEYMPSSESTSPILPASHHANDLGAFSPVLVPLTQKNCPSTHTTDNKSFLMYETSWAETDQSSLVFVDRCCETDLPFEVVTIGNQPNMGHHAHITAIISPNDTFPTDYDTGSDKHSTATSPSDDSIACDVAPENAHASEQTELPMMQEQHQTGITTTAVSLDAASVLNSGSIGWQPSGMAAAMVESAPDAIQNGEETDAHQKKDIFIPFLRKQNESLLYANIIDEQSAHFMLPAHQQNVALNNDNGMPNIAVEDHVHHDSLGGMGLRQGKEEEHGSSEILVSLPAEIIQIRRSSWTRPVDRADALPPALAEEQTKIMLRPRSSDDASLMGSASARDEAAMEKGDEKHDSGAASADDSQYLHTKPIGIFKHAARKNRYPADVYPSNSAFEASSPASPHQASVDVIEELIGDLTWSTIKTPNAQHMMSAAGNDSGHKTLSKKKLTFERTAVLLDAAANGEYDTVVRMIEGEGIHLDICNGDGVTALHCAAGFGQESVVEYLVSAGANINATEDEGWTPLHNAALAGLSNIVDYLIQHGADVEACTLDGSTPLDVSDSPVVIAALNEVSLRKYSDQWLTAIYTFDKSCLPDPLGNELFFQKDDRLRILKREDPDWWHAERHGISGYIPKAFVQ